MTKWDVFFNKISFLVHQTSSISFSLLGSRWSNKSTTAHVMLPYERFRPPFYCPHKRDITKWINSFPKDISTKWNSNIWNLKSAGRFHYIYGGSVCTQVLVIVIIKLRLYKLVIGLAIFLVFMSDCVCFIASKPLSLPWLKVQRGRQSRYALSHICMLSQRFSLNSHYGCVSIFQVTKRAMCHHQGTVFVASFLIFSWKRWLPS